MRPLWFRFRTLLSRPIFWLADELFTLADWITPNFLAEVNFDHLRQELADRHLETYTTGTGQKILVHARNADCEEGCVIHNPSDHPMKLFKTHWRGDRHLMERICILHGTGHPDPDDLRYKMRTRGKPHALIESVHGCCGCCQGSYDFLK